jgi:hypothetical protein
MKIFKSLELSTPAGATCQECVHFQNEPARIEETYSGLTVMSSGYASVRDRDGICNYHQIYLSARDSCTDFVDSKPRVNQHAVE